LKKNQQQTQYYQDSVHEDFLGNVGVMKAKSLGKKGANSIREKNPDKYGQKSTIKPSKSTFNNHPEMSKKNEKFGE
jgi:hypothetical protein